MEALVTSKPPGPRHAPRWIGRFAESAGRLPLMRGPLTALYSYRFKHARGFDVRQFHGVYPDFTAARRAIPAHGVASCDNEASVMRVADQPARIISSDYPAMFWLQRLLPECRRLFDWGGSVGISYYAYRKYLDYPQRFEWLVCELPGVAELGRRRAQQQQARGLYFTDRLEQASGADVLLAAGSFHFIDDPIGELCRCADLPRHLLLNKIPVYELADAVTLQNMGTAFCPNHLFNRAGLLRSLEGLGYRLVDEWSVQELSCRIPLHPEHSIPAYSGFYLRRP